MENAHQCQNGHKRNLDAFATGSCILKNEKGKCRLDTEHCGYGSKSGLAPYGADQE